MPGQFSVAINIGANLLPSLGAAVSKVDRAFAGMSRRMKITAAESRVAGREMAAAMKPLASLALAGGLSAGLKGILGEGAEYQHQISMMRLAGRTSREMSAAIAAANRTIADVPTATLNDSLKLLNETTLAYGGLGHAIDNLPFNARMGALMKNIMGDGYDEAGGFNQLVRALELRSGKMSPADYQRQASGLFRAMEVSGGTVNPENFLGFAQQAGLALRGFNESFLTRVVPSLIQEMGGERAGTAATALFNQFQGRVAMGGKSVTAEWTRLGLVPAKGAGGNLSATGWAPGTLKNNAVAMANPLEWIEGTLFPALRAHGIDTNDKNAMLTQAQKMFGRETGKRLASTLFDPAQLARIHADMALYDKAMGPDKAYAEAMRTDPRMALAATANSLKNLETTLGKSLFTPSTITAIQNAARAINWLASAFDNHPNLARGVVALTGLGAIAATLKVFGIALGWIFSPLKGIFGLLGSGFTRLLPLAGNALLAFFRTGLWRMLYGGGRWIVMGLLRLGPWLLRGILMLVPTILEGIGGIIVAVLGAPVWVTVAIVAAVAAAAAFVWHFRHEIGAGFSRAWAEIKSYFLSNSWGQIGKDIAWAIANGLTLGLAGLIPQIVQGFRRSITIDPNIRGGPMPAAAPKTGNGSPVVRGPVSRDPTMRAGLAGMRAAGGPVWPGGTFLVGENGPELFTPGRSGTIIPHHELQRRRAVRDGGVSIRDVHIHGANDPESTRRILRQELQRMANGNAALLSD